MLAKPMELQRAHLEAAIEDILHKPLCIVMAPSGYGKTTIVKRTLEKHTEMKEYWLSLGNSEVDEIWVWRKLCDTFIEQNPQLYKAMLEIGLPATAQETDHFISAVRRYILSPVCIILDDYHECNGKLINRLIERIVYEEITNLHILIISRVYPDIACEELFLKGYCSIIDQQMLALSKEESKEIFHINNIDLSEIELDKMYEYTDGWIAAVYLVLYDYMRSGRFEHLSNVSRLLKSAVFDKFSDYMQEVCMKMSLFKRFTLEEARYVTGMDISRHSLTQVQERFGFIQFDVDSGNYIMHALLRSVAGAELEKRGLDKQKLYWRCGEYRERDGQYINAILCYKYAGADEEILKILSEDNRNEAYEQAPGVIESILDSMPLEIKMKYPIAYLTYIYSIILKDNPQKGKRLYYEVLDACETMLERGHDYNQLKGELMLIEALLCFNDLEQVNAKLKKAYELLDNHVSQIFHHSLLTFGAPTMTVLYYKKSGELVQTIQQQKEYARYHMALIKGINGDWDDFFEAEYALMRNDIETARLLSERVVEKATFANSSICIVISSYYVRVRSLICQGKEKEFYEVMEEFEKQMKNVVRPVLLTDYELACGYVYSSIGRLDKVPEWLCRFDLAQCSRMVRNVRSGCVVYGGMLCQMKKWVRLNAVAEQMLMPYESTRHTYIIIFGYIFKAIAEYNLGVTEKACEYLRKAVELAEPDDVIIPFVENGGMILPLVQKLAEEKRFCKNLLEPIRDYQRALKAFNGNTEVHSILTGREAELMQYVREGLRNSEISDRMHIALVTVEKNLTSIYRKLNVSNRAAAVARLEELTN